MNTASATQGSTPRPPGPPNRKGIVASAKYFYRFMTDAVGFVGERFGTYGDLYYAPNDRGGHLFVVRHPDHVNEVLVSRGADFDKQHSGMVRLKRALGNGLLTSDGDLWRRHRRLLQPAFGKQSLAGYRETMVAETRRAIASWPLGSTRDIGEEMTSITLKIVCRTLFGSGMSSAEINDVASAMTAVQEMLAPDELQRVLFWRAKRHARSLAKLEQLLSRLIEQARQQESASDDLLSKLVAAVDEEDGSKLSNEELRDHLVTLFLAGHDTSSHALTFALLGVAEHPAVQRQIQAEVAALDSDASVEEQVQATPRLRQCLLEAMRLYPPAYSVARRAIKDTSIGGFAVPKGSEVIVWIYWTHRHPDFYERPLEFYPDHFLPAAEAARHRQAHLPFGAGARTCIGKMFAMMEMHIVLLEIAKKFWVSRAVGAAPVGVRTRITLMPDRPVELTLRARAS